MDRRLGGVLLLVVVAVLAAIGPALVGRPVAGTAQPASIPAPPFIGQCIGDDPTASDVTRGPWLRSVEFVACEGDHFGEVVDVVPEGGSFSRQSRPGVTEPDVGACEGPASRYLGQSAPVLSDPALRRWDPVPAGSISIAGPTPLQRAAGQTWVVCLLGSAQAYRGSSAGAFSVARVLTAGLGTCLTDPDAVTYPIVPCGEAHRTEVLATTSLDDDDLLGDRLTDSCTVLAAAVTGRPGGSTDGGELTAAALVVHFRNGRPTAGLPDAGPVRGWAACAVSVGPDRALTGSVIGLGTAELPWAG